MEQQIDEAEWSWLAPHLKRDAIIIVDIKLDLAHVAARVAEDDKEQIQDWIQQGRLGKPSLNQIEIWNKSPSKKFLTTVVQPFVLVQEYMIH